MVNVCTRVWHKLTDLNLFSSGSTEPAVIQKERWSTGLYLGLLIVSVLVLVIYTGFGIQTVHVTVEEPSFQTFERLQQMYPKTLKCPCTEIAVKYGSFVQMEPMYHQICSSSFVTQEWISLSYKFNSSNIWPMDVRTISSAHGQFLRSFCINTQQAIAIVLSSILSSSLISDEVLPLSLVTTQVNIQQGILQSAGQWQLTVLITFFRLISSSSQMMSGLGTNSFLYMPSNQSTAASTGINAYQLNSQSYPCYCYAASNCPTSGAVYTSHPTPSFGFYDLGTLANSSIPVKGMQGGCYPLESVLASTLECYYDRSCLELLVSNASSVVPLSTGLQSNFPRNTTIEVLMNALMVENWLLNMSFAGYYAECAPKTCAYSYNQRNNFLVVITTIFALIGGLNSVLRFLVPWLVQFLGRLIERLRFKKQSPIERLPVVWVEQTSTIVKIKKKILWLWEQVTMINLFDSKSIDVSKQKTERQTTRLYIIFVGIAVVVLFTSTITANETKVYTVENVSQADYDKLYAANADTIQCACKNIAIEYSKFISIDASYHQICSSSFVSPNFFAQLAAIRPDSPLYPGDFMVMSLGYFQWLTTFCSLSQVVFSRQLSGFNTNLFVNNKLLSRNVFEIQATQLADFFISDVQFYFARGIKQTRELFGFSQPILATWQITYQLPITSTSSGSQVRIEPAHLISGCSCITNPTSCSEGAAFYSYNSMSNSFNSVFNVSGIRVSCSSMESVLQSDLECWYSATCYQLVLQYWQNRTYQLYGAPTVLKNIPPSRFQLSTPLSTIIEHLMVETWSNNVSYDSYFRECAPLYCTYSITERKNIFLIITTLIGIFGGLNIALKLITPLLVQLGNWLTTHRQRHVHMFHRNIRDFPSRLAKMNLFFHSTQSSVLTMKRELHSTRAYLFFLSVCMLILLFYYSLVPSTLTIIVSNPSQQTYLKLSSSNGISSLQCPCTSVSVTFKDFVQVNTTLHEICSSSFIEQDWILSIYGNGDWSTVPSNDISGRGVLYFQGLYSLCYLFRENITLYASHFLSSTLISAQMISESQLFIQVNEVTDRAQASARTDQSSMYNFAIDLENANQMMTIYSSNWIYSPIQYDPYLVGLPIPVQPVSHGNCSCAVSSTCIEPVAYQGEIVPGFALGCLPLQSLLQSTLICLYNQTCVNQINMKNLSVSPLVLPSNGKFSVNRTIQQLVENALDQQWFVNISYSDFFKQCQPSTCSYSINQRKDIVQIIVILLGFYGGLTVALRTILSHLIEFLHTIARKFQHRKRPVRPENEQKF